jgi:hypothetical protein
MIRTLVPVVLALPTGALLGFFFALYGVRGMIRKGELVSSDTLRRLSKERERRK